jgi:hypothetical protein
LSHHQFSGIVSPENEFFFQVFVAGFFKCSADRAFGEFFFQDVIHPVLMSGVFQIFFTGQADFVSAAEKGFEFLWGLQADGARRVVLLLRGCKDCVGFGYRVVFYDDHCGFRCKRVCPCSLGQLDTL